MSPPASTTKPTSMRILITGSSGILGSWMVRYFLARSHTITAVDKRPFPLETLGDVCDENLEVFECDLADVEEVDAIFNRIGELDGVIHLGGYAGIGKTDHRIVHNTNVAAAYNILQTCARRGITRIVQASSVHAPGLHWAPPGHLIYGELPMDETIPLKPEDPYALSKAILEIQADALCRYYPDLRIASLRLHFCRPDYASAVEVAEKDSLGGWVANDAVASAALLALVSEGWSGHEVFNICAPEIAFGGSAKDKTAGISSLQLLETYWSGKHGYVDKGWWEGHSRRSFWKVDKAERLLGWKHNESMIS